MQIQHLGLRIQRLTGTGMFMGADRILLPEKPPAVLLGKCWVVGLFHAWPYLCLNPSPQQPVAPVPSASQLKEQGISKPLCSLPHALSACGTAIQPGQSSRSLCCVLYAQCSTHGCTLSCCHPTFSVVTTPGRYRAPFRSPHVVCRLLRSFLLLALHPHVCTLPRNHTCTQDGAVICVSAGASHSPSQLLNLQHVNRGTRTIALGNGLN
jgi:hypothetical protein